MARRILLLDALRGFALLGIIQINLPAFLAGPVRDDVLLQLGASPADWCVWFCQTLFVQGKFYPIFAFLLGYGYHLQATGLARRGADARRILLRRYGVLLVLGVLHGLLLFFGDILTMYALAGFVMILQGDGARRVMQRRIVYWLVVTLLLGTAARLGSALAATAPDAETLLLSRSLEQLAAGPFWPGAWLRAQWYLAAQGIEAAMFLPQILFFMTLGAYGARAGWIAHPGLHRAFWRRAAALGAGIGLPLNLAYAVCAWQLARASGALPYLAQIYDMLDQFVASLSLLYVAALVGLARHARASLLAACIIGLIAACGRLALTNYLTQSLMMVLLLSSLGFGLASQAPFTRLALWGVVIVIGEAAASALYLRFFSTGPVEWLWRRLTYGRVG